MRLIKMMVVMPLTLGAHGIICKVWATKLGSQTPVLEGGDGLILVSPVACLLINLFTETAQDEESA
jgi:hypothetical protein